MALPLSPSSAIFTAAVTALLLLYLLYRHVLHPALLSPLSKLPAAHPTSPFSPLWLRHAQYTKRESQLIKRAHDRYGSIVRLAPSEVSVNSLEGLRKLYTKNMDRSAFFLQFRNYNGTPNLVGSLGGEEHVRRKKVSKPVYNKSFLMESTDLRRVLDNVVWGRLVPVLEGAVEEEEEEGRFGKGIDVFGLMSAVSVEIMSGYAVGSAGGTDLVRPGKEAERERVGVPLWLSW